MKEQPGIFEYIVILFMFAIVTVAAVTLFLQWLYGQVAVIWPAPFVAAGLPLSLTFWQTFIVDLAIGVVAGILHGIFGRKK